MCCPAENQARFKRRDKTTYKRSPRLLTGRVQETFNRRISLCCPQALRSALPTLTTAVALLARWVYFRGCKGIKAKVEII